MTSILPNPPVKNRPTINMMFGENLHSSEPIEIITDGSDLLFLGVRFPGPRFLQRIDLTGIEFHFSHLEGVPRDIMSLRDFLPSIYFFFHHK